MRIAIITIGRFQLLELARELAALGHEVRCYSCLRPKRLERFRLPKGCHRRILRVPFPVLAAQRAGTAVLPRLFDPLLHRLVDRAAAQRLGECDFLIGSSGLCLRSLVRARRRFGARVFLEVNSRHILAHKDILESIPGARRPAILQFEIRRELQGYAAADVVSVPTRQSERSFLERGVLQERLLWNPPGADLEVFVPTARPQLDAPTLLCVGRWSVRKGCEMLGRAVARQPWRLVHVGIEGDAPLPSLDRFERLDPRPLSEMRQVYRSAHVFVDASLDDEVATATLQAAASGLPLVCSDRSRGEDLRSASSDPTAVTIVPGQHPAAWRDAIASALDRAERRAGLRAWLPRAAAEFSWKAYGLRYEREMKRLLAAETGKPATP